MEDLEAIEEQRMDVIQELADLERERDKEAKQLRRRAHQTILRINFSQLEEDMLELRRFTIDSLLREKTVLNSWVPMRMENLLIPKEGCPNQDTILITRIWPGRLLI